MIFVETSLFTKLLGDYMDDDEYKRFQGYLMENPEIGDIITGTGGLRKIRWSLDNKGKRGGIRIIYYWQASVDQLYLLTLYAKNEMADLSSNEKKALRQMIERWNNG